MSERKPLEQVRRRDVVQIERRILAHQHDVEGAQIEHLGGAERVVIAALAAHLQRARQRLHPAVVVTQVGRQVVIQTVAAALGLERQHERAVAVDVDPLDRIHLDRHGKAHRALPWHAARADSGGP